MNMQKSTIYPVNEVLNLEELADIMPATLAHFLPLIWVFLWVLNINPLKFGQGLLKSLRRGWQHGKCNISPLVAE